MLISGTVGAALQGYLRGLPAIAISVDELNGSYLSNAAKLAALLAKKIDANIIPNHAFLNVNLPSTPLEKIRGVRFTRLASETHTDTVEEGHDGRRQYYWIVRQKTGKSASEKTDVWAIEQDNISITPLHINRYDKPSSPIPDSLGAGLLYELQNS